MSVAAELFLLGVVMSFGPCTLHCSALMIPYIAATKNGWKAGLSTMLVFLVVRIAVYTLLGLLAGIAGRMISVKLHEYQAVLSAVAGSVIAGFGIMILTGLDPGNKLCRFIRRRVSGKDSKGGVAVMSIALSMVPCVSLLAVLSYIAFKAPHTAAGALYGFSFGLGKLVSPLIPLGMAAGWISRRLRPGERLQKIVTLICGVLLVVMGINLAMRLWQPWA